MKHHKLDKKKYRLLDKKIEVIFDTKQHRPSRKELYYIDNDANGLIAEALWEKCIFFHASCVASRKNYLLFLGPSMSGKSTIATYLSQRGFVLLSDDDSILRYELLKPLLFPTFGNLKPYAVFLDSIKEVKNDVLSYIYKIDDSEFKKIYDLGRRLYRNGATDANRKKRINFIFIKGRAKEKPRLKFVKKTDSEAIQWFFRSIKTSEIKRNAKILEIMELYGKSNMYSLTMGTPKETADLISRKFK